MLVRVFLMVKPGPDVLHIMPNEVTQSITVHMVSTQHKRLPNIKDHKYSHNALVLKCNKKRVGTDFIHSLHMHSGMIEKLVAKF